MKLESVILGANPALFGRIQTNGLGDLDATVRLILCYVLQAIYHFIVYAVRIYQFMLHQDSFSRVKLGSLVKLWFKEF